MGQDDLDKVVKESIEEVINVIQKYVDDNPQLGKAEMRKFLKDLNANFILDLNEQIDSFIESLNQDEGQKELAFEYAGEIFEIMDLLTNDLNVAPERLTEIMLNDETAIKKDVIEAFVQNSNDKQNFIRQIVKKFKEEKLQHGELVSIRALRQSPEARQNVMRKMITETLKMDTNSNILKKFLSEYSVATKAEAMVRIEKYIESGWFEQDRPLKDYYNVKSIHYGNEQVAVSSLKTAMQKRFKTALFEREVVALNNYHYPKFNLKIADECRSPVFGLAPSGQKDFCIEDISGKKLYVGDVTTDETGNMNHNSWFNGLKASKELGLKTGKEIDYSVVITSLFYDKENNEAILKSKFLNKLNNVDQDFIDNMHFLQFISGVQRAGITVDFDIVDLINSVNVQYIGSKSETVVNNYLKLKGNDFINKSLDIVDSVIDKIINDRVLENGYKAKFYGEHEKSHVETIPVGILLNSIIGLGNLVVRDEKLMERYSSLSSKVVQLKDAVIADGELTQLIQNARMTTRNIDTLREDYLESKEKYDSFQSDMSKKIEAEKALVEEKNSILNKNKDKYSNYFGKISLFVSQLIELEKMFFEVTKNKGSTIDLHMLEKSQDILIDFKLGIENEKYFQLDASISNSLKSKTVPDSKKHSRTVIRDLVNAVNSSLKSEMINKANNFDIVEKSMSNFVSNIDEYINVQFAKVNSMYVYGSKKMVQKYRHLSKEDLVEHLTNLANEINNDMKVLINDIQESGEQLRLDSKQLICNKNKCFGNK